MCPKPSGSQCVLQLLCLTCCKVLSRQLYDMHVMSRVIVNSDLADLHSKPSMLPCAFGPKSLLASLRLVKCYVFQFMRKSCLVTHLYPLLVHLARRTTWLLPLKDTPGQAFFLVACLGFLKTRVFRQTLVSVLTNRLKEKPIVTESLVGSKGQRQTHCSTS